MSLTTELAVCLTRNNKTKPHNQGDHEEIRSSAKVIFCYYLLSYRIQFLTSSDERTAADTGICIVGLPYTCHVALSSSESPTIKYAYDNGSPSRQINT